MFHVGVHPASVPPRPGGHTMLLLSVCLRTRTACVRLQGRARQQHIWLLSGPWKCNSDLEVLRCLFIARSLRAWPYSLWHFQPLICRRTVMEWPSWVTWRSCHTIFQITEVAQPGGGRDARVKFSFDPVNFHRRLLLGYWHLYDINQHCHSNILNSLGVFLNRCYF